MHALKSKIKYDRPESNNTCEHTQMCKIDKLVKTRRFMEFRSGVPKEYAIEVLVLETKCCWTIVIEMIRGHFVESALWRFVLYRNKLPMLFPF